MSIATAEHPLKGQVITVDGPTASGKGTLAKRLAKRYRMKFLDTGCLYRAVAWLAISGGGNPSDEAAALAAARHLAGGGVFDFRHKGNNVFGVWIDGREVTDDIRTPQVSAGASMVAAIPAVRTALLDVQKNFVAEWQPIYGVILDGRDTGARIAPHAGLKLFLLADPAKRAERRFAEYAAAGKTLVEADVLRDLLARDERDLPNTLRTPDAHAIDATALGIEAVEAEAVRLASQAFGI
ncbi:MAG TPA: (d)CMP kinase [Alphaproteobacteria bacterium]|nr:(d)CMP kinase [Alphaproteobacteria bacterium]